MIKTWEERKKLNEWPGQYTTVDCMQTEIDELRAEFGKVTVERDADKKMIRELDAELGDAKIAIQSSQSCTTHYSDLLKTREEERDSLRAELEIANSMLKAKLKNSAAGAQTDTKELAELRAEVVAFAEAMEQKLRKNDWKTHWSHMSLQYLSMRLTQEREELRKAVEIGDPEEVLREAADVANFAMMIADMVRRSPKTANLIKAAS